jgi:MYXO-CTERM domain-containing protein
MTRAIRMSDFFLSKMSCALGLACSTFLLCPAHAFGLGATVPFTTHEAEAGVLGGGADVRILAAPTNTTWSSPELEASGRAFVELKATDDSVTLPNDTGANVTAIDFRYSIPDAPTGGGIDSTLDLYVDGVLRQSVAVTSRQTWVYDGTDWDGMSQDPTVPNPHLFFEEVHTFITGNPIKPGSKIMLKKDAANGASFYWIDLMDLEAPPAPVTQPANSLSITDYGAVPTMPADGPVPANAVDSSAAIQKAIDAASAQNKTLWIPQGRFIVGAEGLNAHGITIAGAGMWYSAIYRNYQLPYGGTSDAPDFLTVDSCTLRDFFLDSNAIDRTAAGGNAGGVNISGTNWLVERLWIQHASSGVWAKGMGGTVQDCRILSTWGDGVNLNNGNSGNVGNNLTANNNYVRGVGDDGVTVNSDASSVQMDTITLENNTTVSIYWADGLRVAGGKNILVQDNLICDPVNFPGIIVGTFNNANLESAIVKGNTIIRSGGDAYNQHQAALTVGVDPGSVTVSNVQVTGNTIWKSMQKAIEIKSGTNLVFDGNLVDSVWANSASASTDVSAIDIVANSTGSVSFLNNTLQNLTATQTAFVNLASATSYQATGMGNSGFDPTAPGPTLWGSGNHPAAIPITVTSCTAPVVASPAVGGSPGDAGIAGSTGSAQTGASGNASMGGQGGVAGAAINLPDGGASAGFPSAGGTANAHGGASNMRGPSTDSGGCGCRAARHPGDSGATALLMTMLGAIAVTRRRRPHRAKQTST